MEDVLLLENPRRRRRRRAAARPRTRVRRRRAAPRARKVRRRRRRNPAVPVVGMALNPRRKVRRRRRGSRAAPRRRRRNPSRGGGGRVLSMRRTMSIMTDGAGLAVSELAGDLAARFLIQKIPGVSDMLARVGVTTEGNQKAIAQLAVAVLSGPFLRRLRFLPKPVVKYWEIANAASALIELTNDFRLTIYNATGLGDYHGGGGGMSDWVTTGPTIPARLAAPAPEAALLGLSDWATVAGSASYTGDPFSI